VQNILRKRVVIERVGLSDTTLWRLERKGLFPKRIRITESGMIGWLESEVQAWIHARVRAVGKRPPGVESAAALPPHRAA
jgi:prophage regulatory protein